MRQYVVYHQGEYGLPGLLSPRSTDSLHLYWQSLLVSPGRRKPTRANRQEMVYLELDHWLYCIVDCIGKQWVTEMLRGKYTWLAKTSKLEYLCEGREELCVQMQAWQHVCHYLDGERILWSLNDQVSVNSGCECLTTLSLREETLLLKFHIRYFLLSDQELLWDLWWTETHLFASRLVLERKRN